jgi:hypothetical protein
MVFVIKILSGALNGAEVVVPAGVCFVRLIEHGADPTSMAVQGERAEPKDTVLSIPVSMPSPNFALTITPVGTLAASLSAEIFDGGPGKADRAVPWNQPSTIGALRFAVKHHDVPWSDEVIQDRGVSPSVFRKSIPKWRYGLGGLAASLVVMAVSVGVWQGARASARPSDVTRVLAGSSWQVNDGRDGVTHVVADSSAAALSARQALGNLTFPLPVRIHTREGEAEKIGAVLRNAGASYLSVNLADARHPEILLKEPSAASQTPSASQAVRALQAGILAAMPYASTVTFRTLLPDETLRTVRQRMADVGVQADVGLTADHLTIRVNDHITDEQLVVLGQAIQELKGRWGPSFVQLIVAQHDHVRLGGVKTGRRGYELRGSSHVYFP